MPTMNPMPIGSKPKWFVTSKNALAGGFIGLSLLVGLAESVGAAPTAQQFMAAQSIAFPSDMQQIEVVSFDGSGMDDIVGLRWADPADSSSGRTTGTLLELVIGINDRKPKAATEPPVFTFTRIPLVTPALIAQLQHDYGIKPTDSAAWLNRINGASLLIADMNGDGYPDLVITNAKTAQITIIWNRWYKVAPGSMPFEFDPTDGHKTQVIGSPWYQSGVPLYSIAADVNTDGFRDLVTYNANFTADGKQYEAFTVNVGGLPASPKDLVGYAAEQSIYRWGDNLQLGKGPVASDGDGFLPGVKLWDYSQGQGLGEAFYTTQTDTIPGQLTGIHSVSSPFSVQGGGAGHVAGDWGLPVIWFAGKDYLYPLVYNRHIHLMQSYDVWNLAPRSTKVTQRGSSMTWGTLPSGQALITCGGFCTYYPPINGLKRIEVTPPGHFSSAYKTGGWTKWVQLDAGGAILSAADYVMPGDNDTGLEYDRDYNLWYQRQLSGTPASLIVNYADTQTMGDGSTQFTPFLTTTDRSSFQILPFKSSYRHAQIQAGAGHFGSSTETSIYIFAEDHLDIYRPYPSDGSVKPPTMHIDGVITASNLLPAVRTVGNVSIEGEGIFLTGDFGVADLSKDAVRYVVVKDSTDTVVKVLPADVPGTDPTGKKFQVAIPGVTALPAGSYSMDVYSSSATPVTVALTIKKPFNVLSTDMDNYANRACGITPTTLGSRFPYQLQASTQDLPTDPVQALRWERIDDHTVTEITTGLNVSGSTVTLPVPSSLAAGTYRVWLEVGGVWRMLPTTWTMTDDAATCQHQAKAVTDQPLGQCDNTSFYPDPAAYPTPLGYASAEVGRVNFYGSGFYHSNVQSVALKQNGKFVAWDNDPELGSRSQPYDNQIYANFGDGLKGKLAKDQPIDVEFYSVKQTDVETYGVTPAGKMASWRTAKEGSCPDTAYQSPEISGLSGITFKPGEIHKVTTKGLMYPGLHSFYMHMVDSDGAEYLVPGTALFGFDDTGTDTLFNTKFDNDHATLNFGIPADLSPYKMVRGAAVKKFLDNPNWQAFVKALPVIAAPATTGSGTLALAAEFVVTKLGPMGVAFAVGYEAGRYDWGKAWVEFKADVKAAAKPRPEEPKYIVRMATYIVMSENLKLDTRIHAVVYKVPSDAKQLDIEYKIRDVISAYAYLEIPSTTVCIATLFPGPISYTAAYPCNVMVWKDIPIGGYGKVQTEGIPYQWHACHITNHINGIYDEIYQSPPGISIMPGWWAPNYNVRFAKSWVYRGYSVTWESASMVVDSCDPTLYTSRSTADDDMTPY